MYCMKCQPSIIRFIINNNKALFQKIDMSEYVSEIDELSFLHNTSMNKITKERKRKKKKVYIISYTKSLYQIYFSSLMLHLKCLCWHSSLIGSLSLLTIIMSYIPNKCACVNIYNTEIKPVFNSKMQLYYLGEYQISNNWIWIAFCWFLPDSISQLQ